MSITTSSVHEPATKPSSGEATATCKPPIINCHAHTFVSGHVPALLAKTYVPWPFYYLFPLHPIVWLFRAWLNGPYRWRFDKDWYKTLVRGIYAVKETLVRDWVLGLLHYLLGLFVGIQVFYIVFGWAGRFLSKSKQATVEALRLRLHQYYVQYVISHWYWQVLLILALCLFFPNARNLLFFVLKKLYGLAISLPGKNTRALAQRYLNLGRFAFHKLQSRNFSDLRAQYPIGTQFVVLPMDMEFMAAGWVPVKLAKQMEDLKKIKAGRNGDRIFPFVFVDPRRIREDPSYFAWRATPNGEVELLDCTIKTYIEELNFSGFKIYPALGYYPFDPELLPLWKYAAQKKLPVVTHCIQGPIFYRGIKHADWDKHPIFADAAGKPIFLPQVKNIEFVVNFTHPLNFLVLLDQGLLAKAVGRGRGAVRTLFGYMETLDEHGTPIEQTIQFGLADLKICLAHFGGEDEWKRYFEMDRYPLTAMLDKHPDKGIDFFNSQGDARPQPAPGKIEAVWKYVDWYSIICSLIIQYENVYADISFILHEPGILPLLKKTLNFPNKQLRKRVLYGTDFYVVRNYKSDREMLAELYAGLDEDEFDVIARHNPREYLNLGMYNGITL
jgi:predicted TIM-barrel fold metal-dependent hydrolase